MSGMSVGCVCTLQTFLKGRYMPFFPFLLPAGRKADVMAAAEAAILELKASRNGGHKWQSNKMEGAWGLTS